MESTIIGNKKNNFFTQILILILANKVCPKTKPHEWFKILRHMHEKGFLYAIVREGFVRAAFCAYKVKEWNEKHAEEMPEKDEGHLLYVPFFVTDGTKALAPLKALKWYLAQNTEVKEIMYYRRNSDKDFRRYSFKYRGVNNV